MSRRVRRERTSEPVPRHARARGALAAGLGLLSLACALFAVDVTEHFVNAPGQSELYDPDAEFRDFAIIGAFAGAATVSALTTILLGAQMFRARRVYVNPVFTIALTVLMLALWNAAYDGGLGASR